MNKIQTYLSFFYFIFRLKKKFEDKNFIKIKPQDKKNKKKIAVELTIFNIESLYLIFITYFTLKKKVDLKIYYYLKKNILSKLMENIFILCVKRNTYLNGIKFINYCYFSSNKDIQIKKVDEIFNKLQSKKDILKIRYKNYKIGKFIFQTYAREQLKVEINIKDKNLKKYILEAFLYVDNSINFFIKNKINHTFASHGTYSKYNIFNMVALKNKSLVSIMFKKGLWNKIRFVKIGKSLYPNSDYENFNINFKKLKNRNKKILSAKNELDKITSGLMKNSSIHKFNLKDEYYNFSKDKNPNKILVLPTCMFDSLLQFKKPGNFLEPYEWLKFILDNAVKTNFSWYVKAHPSGHAANTAIFDNLKKQYPKINFIDKATLVKKKFFKSMFTYQSTGAHEYINGNVPVVISEDNLQSSFEFGRPVNSKNMLKKK